MWIGNDLNNNSIRKDSKHCGKTEFINDRKSSNHRKISIKKRKEESSGIIKISDCLIEVN